MTGKNANIKETFVRRLPFVVVVLLCVVMGAATFIEKYRGAGFAGHYVYGTWWFALLWGALAALAIVGLVKGKVYRNPPLLLTHLSLILILAGALITRLTAEHGYAVLSKGTICSSFKTETSTKRLPFDITLDEFRIVYYDGTDAPSDYVSRFTIYDPATGNSIAAEAAMNDIYKYRGYRFYQSSFEDDMRTSVLSVSRDVAGIPVTYAGYALFAVSMLWYLVSPRGAFRRLQAHPLLKKTLTAVLLLAPFSAQAQVMTPDSLTIERQYARELGKLRILYNGRIAPLNTFANDFTLKITGSDTFSYLNADQLLAGLLFFPERWQNVALFEVNDPTLRQELNAETHKAAISDFYDANGDYKLRKYWRDMGNKSPKSGLLKEVEKLNEKIQLIDMLHRGNLLRIYPQQIGGHIRWFYPTQELLTEEEQLNAGIIRTSLLTYYNAINSNDEAGTAAALKAISDFQKKQAANVMPSDMRRDAEIFYTRADIVSTLFKVNLTLGIIALISLSAVRGLRSKNTIQKSLYWAATIAFAILTLAIGLRTYIGGRLPFSNGYETMLLIAWCAMLIAASIGRRIRVATAFGLLISGFSLLVAHLAMGNPQITPLVPVLSSPLLSIHVMTIMLAYTLLGFIALNGIVSMLQLLAGRNRNTVLLRLKQNALYSRLCLYPAMFFLGCGIFIGAVWANVSWGRYWGWDPKEVWALITFLIYGLAAHGKTLQTLRDPLYFHVFGSAAFSTVLMTYFGVNYFIGGMHSYAGEMQLSSTLIYLSAIFAAMIAVVMLAIRKYKKWGGNNKKQLSNTF